MIRAKNISYQVGSKILLQPTDITFTPGQFHVIMGANGAGKSTLLKLLADDYKPITGEIWYGDKPLKEFTKKRLAKKRAVLSQQYLLNFPISVDEVVLMGRYPYFAAQPSKHDLDICMQTLSLMKVDEFIERDYNTLSGGEAQKVQMSRVLAQVWPENDQEQKVLFLDEPVSHLDVKYQHQLLRVAKDLCKQHVTVIAILHDINLALSYADRIVFMKHGNIIHDLAEPFSITKEIISDTFEISASIIRNTEQAKPFVIFLGL